MLFECCDHFWKTADDPFRLLFRQIHDKINKRVSVCHSKNSFIFFFYYTPARAQILSKQENKQKYGEFMEINVNEKFEISPEEKELVIKYRENPEMQAAINKILELENAPDKEQSKIKKGKGAKVGIYIACGMIYVIITVLFSLAGYHPGGLVAGTIAGVLALLAAALCKAYDKKKEAPRENPQAVSENIVEPQPEQKIMSPKENEELYEMQLQEVAAITISILIFTIVIILIITAICSA